MRPASPGLSSTPRSECRPVQLVLTALILAGERVSADLLLSGIRQLVEEAKAQPWRMDPHQGPLYDWLALLPFSERPTAVMEALASLPPPQRHPRQLGPLLNALGDAPADEALTVLETLAR